MNATHYLDEDRDKYLSIRVIWNGKVSEVEIVQTDDVFEEKELRVLLDGKLIGSSKGVRLADKEVILEEPNKKQEDKHPPLDSLVPYNPQTGERLT